MAILHPFPFAALPALSRADLFARDAVRARLGGRIDETAAREQASELLGSKLGLRYRGACSMPSQRGASGDVGVLLGPDDDSGFERAVLLELDGALAAQLVATALRGRAPTVHDTHRVASPSVIGALAAVVLAVVRRVAPTPPRVLAAGPLHALAADLGRHSPTLASVQYTVDFAGAGFSLRLSCLPTLFEHHTPFQLEDAGILPLALPLVLGSLVLPHGELEALQVGDALVGGAFADLGREGEAWLCAAHDEQGVTLDYSDQALIYRGEPATLSWSAEAESWSMDQEAQESLGDVPVVVRVELGSVELSARKWAELRPGDALTLGKRVGAPVSLRVSGVEVARGELVQIEGEMGVRITERVRG